MNLEELEKWFETPEGKTWTEAMKKGLVDKNTELLAKVTSGNAAIGQLNEKIASLESDLATANGKVREVLLSGPLAEKLKEKGVFEVLIPNLIETLSETYGLQIADGNAIGKVKEGGKETVLTLDQVIEKWTASDKSKDCFKPQDVKTESTAPDLKGNGVTVDKEWAAMRRGAGLPEKE